MGKRDRKIKNVTPPTETPAGIAMTREEALEAAEKLKNSLAPILSALGIGGGHPIGGFPFNQGTGWSAQVESVDTIFKNLRWYMVSNMRQVLNQAYVEFGLLQTIVDVPVDDALRGGIQIQSQQLEEDQIEDLKAFMDRNNDLNKAGQSAKWNRLFGGAGILVLTDQDPEEPLDLDAITEDTPLDFRAVDMWELFGTQQNVESYAVLIDADGDDDDDSDCFDYYGIRVHRSRVFILKGLEAPSFIRPRLRGWGFSVVEKLVRSINQYLKSTDLSFEVLDEFKVDIFKMEGFNQSIASPQGREAIQQRVQMANLQKNYQNALMMDKEDDWDHKQLAFSGLGDMMMQIRMQVAADMRMPLTKLFGISAAGFNSGEDDIEVYNSMVESEVRDKIKHIILKVVELRCQQLFGFIPDDLILSFQPLRYMSSEQEENVKTQKFNRAIQAFQAGIISLKEFKENANKAKLFDITLDTSVDELQTDYNSDEFQEDGDSGLRPKKVAKEKNDLPRDDPKAKEAPKDPPKKRKADTGSPGRVNNSVKKIKPFTTQEKIGRKLKNSAAFDRASYEADGGDGWIHPKRELFFDRDKALNKSLWDRAERAAVAAYGSQKWQFVVWMYLKLGGKFGIAA
jgi:phage-related protein (TIGR01555 family)